MSSLEGSITLDDVFNVVEAKRVPLAPELAGYLTLEIADGTDAGSGNVDPKTVFISEEGTVALVRPKKNLVTGDAEASVRSLLAKLLEASGSGTPALTTAAKRKPGNGLPALVEELEAALIPVNRAAGRRALARLAREVKRVLLGVGRNASVAPVQSRAEKPHVTVPPHARPALRKKEDEGKPPLPKPPPTDVSANLRPPHGEVALRPRLGSFDDEAATAKRTNELAALLAADMNAVESGPVATPAQEAETRVAQARVEPKPLTTSEPRAPVATPRPLPPPPATSGGGLPPPPPVPKRDALGAAAEPTADPPNPLNPLNPPIPSLFAGDEVDSLLDSFGVSNAHEDKQMARELKAIAGLSPTPPPPDAKTLAELTKDVGKALPKKLSPSIDGDSVEALLALTDASAPAIAVRAKSDPLPAVAPLVAPPPVAVALPPIAPANLPPSPIFGPGGATTSAASAASAPGAPAALRQTAEPSPRGRADEVETLKPPREPVPREPEPPRARIAPAPAPSTSRGKVETAPSPQPTRRRDARDKPRAPKTGMAMLMFALLVLAGGAVAVWKFAPQVFTGRRKPIPTTAISAGPVAPPRCKVALVLTEVPANAEILLRMGQAPVDVERMPVGTRLELVATAEGYAPRRAVIKGESPWDKGPDGKPRIEVPIQLDASKAKAGAVDPWPVAEPGSQVGGSGAPGTVHVVSNVRGAEVWLLAGLGPEARIDQLRCDADIDVLFAGPPALRKRLHLSEAEISATAADAQGNKIVTVNASSGVK